MDTQPAFGFQELYAQLVGGIAKALCERAGETSQQKFARTQAAAHAIMAFLPRDAIEVMLAGHCVMFHELMVDSVGDTLRGVASPALRAARGNIVAMDRAFGNNLTRLEHYQSRRSEGRRDVGNAAVEAVAETEIDDRVRRHRGQARAGEGPEGQVQAGAVDTRDRDELSGAPVVVAGQGRLLPRFVPLQVLTGPIPVVTV